MLTGKVIWDVPTGTRQAKLVFDGCAAYILGAFDQLSLLGQICPGEGFSTLQALAIARKFLAEHPELRDQAPAFMVAKAFKDAFPCNP